MKHKLCYDSLHYILLSWLGGAVITAKEDEDLTNELMDVGKAAHKRATKITYCANYRGNEVYV